MRNINTEQQWPVANIWSRDPMTDDPFWPGDEDVSSLSDGGMPREDAEALRMARLHIALEMHDQAFQGLTGGKNTNRRFRRHW